MIIAEFIHYKQVYSANKTTTAFELSKYASHDVDYVEGLQSM